uniref:2-oxoglutarate dehydrogenase, mitochondrial n=1 Tax=Glossina pallidipes TaxID=7398 RepID=A0A1B0AEU2_GLOPL
DLASNEPPAKQRRFESNNKGRGSGAAKRAEVSVGSGNSATYVEDMYNAWKRDPGSVHASWNAFFASGAYECVPPEHTSQRNLVPLSHLCGHNPRSEIIEGHLNAQSVIRSYQTRGFLTADLDPLGITQSKKITTPCGMELRATEAVLMMVSNFVKGEYLNV